MAKKWYESKTKVGALLVGAGALLGTIGALVNGDVATIDAITAMATQLGAVLAAFGIRDWNLVNKK